MDNNLHPAWKVCIGLAIVLFVAIAAGGRVLLMQQDMLDEINIQQQNGEERSYINRAIAGCADIINDGEIEITSECLDPRVAAYYPPSICAKLLIEVEECGSKAVVIVSL